MALTGMDFNDLGKSSVLPTATGQICFDCGASLSDPARMWEGMAGAIYMHVSCALNIAIRMNHDIWVYQKRKNITAVSS